MDKERFVLYIDVGCMPQKRAEKYATEVREKFIADHEIGKNSGEEWFFIAVRNEGPTSVTRIERL
jgi:hypothetical protein